jgi:phosphoribosylglycinamide formyltransferase-1
VDSNHEHGGVRQRADKLGIPFIHFPAPYTAEEYQRIVKSVAAEFVALSGWIKIVRGLDPKVTFNIHPGPLPRFGGKGMYGHHVHEAVMEAFKKGEAIESEINMHFVTDEYDKGPTFLKIKIPILKDDTADTLFARANAEEHKWQPIMTNKILKGEIGWDGKDPASLFGAHIEE